MYVAYIPSKYKHSGYIPSSAYFHPMRTKMQASNLKTIYVPAWLNYCKQLQQMKSHERKQKNPNG